MSGIIVRLVLASALGLGSGAGGPGTAGLPPFASSLLPSAILTPRASESGGTATGSDSVRAELAMGRYWHASVRLREEGSRSGGVTPERVLELAKAEAGCGNWSAVVRILDGVTWLGTVGGGEGWALLARGKEEGGDWASAAGAYARYLESDATPTDRTVARFRRSVVLSRAGDFQELVEELATATRSVSPEVTSWGALEAIRGVAEGRAGPEVVGGLLPFVSARAALGAALGVLGDLQLEAGDTLSAVHSYERGSRDLEDADERAVLLLRGAVLRLALSDTVGARQGFESVVAQGPRSEPGIRAARYLIDLGVSDGGQALELARRLQDAGDAEGAVRGFALFWALPVTDPPTQEIRLRRARAWMAVGRLREAGEELEQLAQSENQAVGGEALANLVRVRRRQGRSGEAETLRAELISRYPSRPEAVEDAFSRADRAHSRGDLAGAITWYERTIARSPASDRAGLSRMRLGQLHVSRGAWKQASEVFEGYLVEFPEGRRWEEAAFWAARTLREGGQPFRGDFYLSRLIEQAPFSYYGVLAAGLNGSSYAPRVEAEGPPVQFFPWVEAGLRELDMLRGMGSADGAAAIIAQMLRRSGSLPGPRLQLAEGLLARGLSLQAVNLGWDIIREGHPWTLRLLRVVYPFPYRDLVEMEAHERGVDPFLLAALIRQESAFFAEAVSPAGAVGLMQVMPSTGAELARSIGPAGFRPSHLKVPDINLHLGSAFLAAMEARYGADLPLVLSAYNAGPSRATLWRRMPEARDALRFVERIPFVETRGYVKNVLRNHAIYSWLYGSREAASASLAEGALDTDPDIRLAGIRRFLTRKIETP